VCTGRRFRLLKGKNTSWMREMRGLSYCTSVMNLSRGVYTTLFTYAGVSENCTWLQRLGADLEESFEPPNLEDTLSYQHTQLEDGPPFDSGVGALCGISMCSFSDNNVSLFVLDLRQGFGQSSNYTTSATCILIKWYNSPSASRGSEDASDSGT
jgi:hypothetical protein